LAPAQHVQRPGYPAAKGDWASQSRSSTPPPPSWPSSRSEFTSPQYLVKNCRFKQQGNFPVATLTLHVLPIYLFPHDLQIRKQKQGSAASLCTRSGHIPPQGRRPHQDSRTPSVSASVLSQSSRGAVPSPSGTRTRLQATLGLGRIMGRFPAVCVSVCARACVVCGGEGGDGCGWARLDPAGVEVGFVSPFFHTPTHTLLLFLPYLSFCLFYLLVFCFALDRLAGPESMADCC
jgi:hypothetical protein